MELHEQYMTCLRHKAILWQSLKFQFDFFAEESFRTGQYQEGFMIKVPFLICIMAIFSRPELKYSKTRLDARKKAMWALYSE